MGTCSGLPLGLLTPAWALHALKHVGVVEQLENNGNGVPIDTDFRAQMLLDLSQPLIPGCYLPTSNDQFIWINFCYEGVFKFCKKCGCVGYYTLHYCLSSYAANRWLRSRMKSYKAQGFRVMMAPMDIPLYSNRIEGLPDRFRHRDTRVDLLGLVDEGLKPGFALASEKDGDSGLHANAVYADGLSNQTRVNSSDVIKSVPPPSARLVSDEMSDEKSNASPKVEGEEELASIVNKEWGVTRGEPMVQSATSCTPVSLSLPSYRESFDDSLGFSVGNFIGATSQSSSFSLTKDASFTVPLPTADSGIVVLFHPNYVVLSNVLPLSECYFESLEERSCSHKRTKEGPVSPYYSPQPYLDVNYQATNWFLMRRRTRLLRNSEFVSLDKYRACVKEADAFDYMDEDFGSILDARIGIGALKRDGLIISYEHRKSRKMSFASSPSASLAVDNYGLEFVSCFRLASLAIGFWPRKRRREGHLLCNESSGKRRKIGFWILFYACLMMRLWIWILIFHSSCHRSIWFRVWMLALHSTQVINKTHFLEL